MTKTTTTNELVSIIINADRTAFVNREKHILVDNGMLRGKEQAPPSLKDMASMLEVALRDSTKVEELLLYDYVERGAFWHAGISLHTLGPKALRGKYDFYAKLIIEQAKQNTGNSETGNAWIVQHYEDWIKRFVSERELKECVNVGFWELMSADIYPPHIYLNLFSKVPDMERYDAVMSYSKYLDLSRTKEFREKFDLVEPLGIRPTYGWPDSKYKEAVEAVLGKLGDRESEAWLACPIVEQIVYDREPCSWSELGRISDLKPYRGYLREPAVKEVIDKTIAHFRSEYGY
jgi:hypothetical protein